MGTSKESSLGEVVKLLFRLSVVRRMRRGRTWVGKSPAARMTEWKPPQAPPKEGMCLAEDTSPNASGGGECLARCSLGM